MHTLVTGGAGFIGSHVVTELLQSGHEVTVYDNLVKGHRDAVDERAEFIHGDILDEPKLLDALQGIDGVIHMAGLISVPESVQEPLAYFKVNLQGALTLLDSMRKQNVKKIIFSSSAAIYGNPQRIPIQEDDAKFPTSPYGSDKLAIESYLSAYFHAFGIHSVSLRYFNAYGPNERHDPETHVIPNFIKALLADQPLTLTGAADQVRDFLYVTDIAKAHVMALQLEDLHQLNLGSGTGVALNELVETLQKVSGKTLRIHNAPARPGDPKLLVADRTKIEKLLNWKPQTSLKDGLQQTIAYFKSL